MSSPTGPSLIHTSRALPIALVGCLVGLLICGVTYAVAGETVHTRDIDLVEPLPEGTIVVADDAPCTTVPGTTDTYCTRSLQLQHESLGPAELAKQLYDLYTDRGFQLAMSASQDGQLSYYGQFGPPGPCAPTLFVGLMETGMVPAGRQGGSGSAGRRRAPTTPPTDVSPSTTASTAPTTAAAIDPATGEVDPTLTVPDPNVTTASVPDESLPPVSALETVPLDQTAPAETAPAESTVVDPGAAVTTTIPTTPTAPPGIDPSTPGLAPTPGFVNYDAVGVELREPYPPACRT